MSKQKAVHTSYMGQGAALGVRGTRLVLRRSGGPVLGRRRAGRGAGAGGGRGARWGPPRGHLQEEHRRKGEHHGAGGAGGGGRQGAVLLRLPGKWPRVHRGNIRYAPGAHQVYNGRTRRMPWAKQQKAGHWLGSGSEGRGPRPDQVADGGEEGLVADAALHQGGARDRRTGALHALQELPLRPPAPQQHGSAAERGMPATGYWGIPRTKPPPP